MKKRFTEEQIVGILRDMAATEKPVPEACRAAVVSYKAVSSPFASEPLALNSAGSLIVGGAGDYSEDADGEILGAGVSVL